MTKKIKHYCELESPSEAQGTAIEGCYERNDDTFWAGNAKYGSQVDYCPVCGTKAPKQIKENTNAE